MAVDHEGCEEVTNMSFCLLPDGERSDGNRTKRDMFDLTIWKIHSLNQPTRRDSSLRKSVLIFNLLRCLQRENTCGDTAEDVEMSPASNVENGDAVADMERGQGADETNAYDSVDAETLSAVVSLTRMDDEEPDESLETSNLCFQLSAAAGSAWNLSSCRATKLETMDVDQGDYSSCPLSGSPCIGNDSGRHLEGGLIAESYRLIENGSYILNDQNFPTELTKLDAGATTNFNNDYCPFGASGGFNLFA